ncbi:PHB depolymerase family esterase [Alcanivorax sp. MM125-6]|nr:PHB depolymerase family esterase [Alcanivorax sp. MM125-6]
MIKKALAVLAGALFLLAAPVHAGSWQDNLSLGGFNNVHLYTPDTDSPVGAGKALLIVLHGCTQSINAYKTANLEVAAEEYGMVVAVPDAMNKAGFSCWSYWQGSKSRSAGDYNNLIDLANELSDDGARGIDPNQVYIAGLSSGASFANTTACLAPDVFAGVGVSAGPSVGTSSIGVCEQANVESRCRNLGGAYQSAFDTQVASIAHGDADTTVDTCYNRQNAEGMAGLYGVSELPGSTVISQDGGSAEEFLWQDGRVSMLWLNGLDHSWSGGQGASGNYIGSASINYARYLGEFFSQNNARVNRNLPPSVDGLTLAANGDAIQISGQAADEDGTVTAITIVIEGLAGGGDTLTTSVDGGGAFQATSGSLADDLYTVAVTAEDNDGGESDPAIDTVRVGPAPPPSAPVLSDIAVSVDGQCATVSGQVVDRNQDLASVTVTFASGAVAADLDGVRYSARACDLPGGTNNASVEALDQGGLADNDQITFQIDAGQVATLDQHISAGRLDYTNYANCYLEYGTDTFKLTEQASGDQCQWQDDDASCTGPIQACAGGGDGGDPQPGCQQESAYNYYHKTAGRAYSTGNYLTPDYFAQGSDQPMAGSTWGNTTLHSSDGGATWQVGTCP